MLPSGSLLVSRNPHPSVPTDLLTSLIDRCHRIGQKRPCVITRLCIEDSVESRMVMLQEKKANMINGTINNDKTSMEKLTPEDMQFLFRGT